ncbi:hypothetical protein PVAP13_7NG362300 [Panicum virgatum]|uniref:Cyclin-like domain-containing protein n=1 Tax=Panicum virgatum TaxID=38727 RepID=A0A8T0Q245_PANVG|nr:hypothetical protein PVAP13_7NG362300 [Panicum virgatum]
MDGEPKILDKLSHERMYSWYFTREELEKFSPSRKDGITESKELELRHLYCSFIRDVGIRLKLPQMTLATAIMFCHRFYIHQSLAKNGWQTVATVCVFLASKAEDTPCPLDHVVRVAYETMYRRDTAAAQRIRQKKALILIGERLVLTTIRFDFNIQHPYRPLFDAMRNLGINQKEVKQVAWNFVNDWLKTTLCLQYKPQYIAAGSLYLAAKLHNIKLPLHGAHVWWHQFDVAPKPLEAVIQQMMEHAAVKKLMPARPSPVKQKEVPCEAKLHISNSPDSVLNQSSLLISSSSPDIGEPSDPMQLDSCQYLTSSHTSDGRVSGPDSSSLSVSAYINVSRKVHDEESLHQASITKHDAGMMSCSNQTSLDAIAATEGSAECMQLDASHCTVNGKILNQASRNWHGGNVNPLSVVISLDAKVDKESTWCVEPLIGSSNHCSDSLIADSLCTDQILADVASVPINNASSALPVLVEAVPSRAELKNVDVVRIKDLLSKRKRQREVQERAIGSDDLGEEAWIERELESGIVMKQEAAASDELSDEAWIERELEAGIVVGPRNKQAITLDGLSEDDWIERELESGIILGPASASKKQKLDSSCC